MRHLRRTSCRRITRGHAAGSSRRRDCSPPDSSSPPAAGSDDGTASSSNSSPGTNQAAGAAAGQAVHTGKTDAGTVLVDAKGMTLYAFAADSPGKSNCTGSCLQYWPAADLSAPVDHSSDVTAKLATIKGSDGDDPADRQWLARLHLRVGLRARSGVRPGQEPLRRALVGVRPGRQADPSLSPTVAWAATRTSSARQPRAIASTQTVMARMSGTSWPSASWTP